MCGGGVRQGRVTFGNILIIERFAGCMYKMWFVLWRGIYLSVVAVKYWYNVTYWAVVRFVRKVVVHKCDLFCIGVSFIQWYRIASHRSVAAVDYWHIAAYRVVIVRFGRLGCMWETCYVCAVAVAGRDGLRLVIYYWSYNILLAKPLRTDIWGAICQVHV